MTDAAQVRAEKNKLICRMFVWTADQNYIVARWAALHYLYLDFLWLGLHAVEKYLKAIILYNGGSAQTQAHNIVALSNDALALDSRLAWKDFEKPSDNHRLLWHQETVASFMLRLNHHGGANNRYLRFGHSFNRDDLYKLDQLVWTIRRHSVPFKRLMRRGHGERTEVDWLAALRNDPTRWKIGPGLPLEKALGGKGHSDVVAAARTLNQPFCPSEDRRFGEWNFGMASSPLGDILDDLVSSKSSLHKRQTASETLGWAVENIYLARQDRKEIEKALTECRRDLA
jgi:hypothetical protein